MSCIVILLNSLLLISAGCIIKRYPHVVAEYSEEPDDDRVYLTQSAVANLYSYGTIVIGVFTLLLSSIFLILDMYVLSAAALIAPTFIGLFLISIFVQRFKAQHAQQVWYERYFSAIVIGLLSLWVTIAFVNGVCPSKITFEGDYVEISGTYGTTFSMERVVSIEMRDRVPRTIRRLNGFSLNHIRKGYFDLEGEGRSLLFVDQKTPPFIRMELSSGTIIYYNLENTIVTWQLYDEIYRRHGANL